MDKILIALIALSLSFSIGCSDDDKDTDGDKSGLSSLTDYNSTNDVFEVNKAVDVITSLGQITVVDELYKPIKAATVLIGDSVGSPFKGNEYITDENGQIDIPQKWAGSMTVTIEAPGFVRTSYIDVEPVEQTLVTTSEDGKKVLEVSGVTKDYGKLRKDGYVDFSLVIPALTKRNMLGFDISSVISPLNDKMTIVGRSFELPSNISLPKQKESYILPITIEKPKYRMQVRKEGFYKFFATHGKFPLKQVVNDMRNGKSIFEIINYFDFIGGGQKDLQVSKNLKNQNISVKQMKFDQTVSIKAPNYSNDLEMVSLALVDQGGYYFPSDLKRVAPKRNQDLSYPSSQAENYVLSVLMNKGAAQYGHQVDPMQFINPDTSINISSMMKFDDLYLNPNIQNKQQASGISISFTQANQGQNVEFIPFVNEPKVSGNTLTLDAPGQVPGILPVGTFVILSEIKQIQNGNIKTEKRTRLWEVLSSGWDKTLTLPDLPTQTKSGKKYRWEVLFLGRSNTANVNDTGRLLDSVTHATRNSFDF